MRSCFLVITEGVSLERIGNRWKAFDGVQVLTQVDRVLIIMESAEFAERLACRYTPIAICRLLLSNFRVSDMVQLCHLKCPCLTNLNPTCKACTGSYDEA